MTDSAGNMVGGNDGFSELMKRALDRPDVITHKCLAHRIQLALETPIKKGLCKNCVKLNLNLKLLSAFYHGSPKRMSSLSKYCKANDRSFIKPKKIHDIRWVGSHLESAKVLFVNWDTFVGHLEFIQSDSDFSTNSVSDIKTRYLARTLLKFLKQKNMLATLAFQMDIQYPFKGVSEIFQRKGQSALGQYSKKQDLISGMIKAKNVDGTFMQALLTESLCESGVDNIQQPCTTLTKFEDVMTWVTWRGIRLINAAPFTPENEPPKNPTKPAQVPSNPNPSNPKTKPKPNPQPDDKQWFSKISIAKDAYVDFILQDIERRMPPLELMNTMSYLDNSKWPLRVRRLLSEPTFLEQLDKWPKIFGLNYPDGTMKNDFEKIVEFLESNTDIWWSTHLSNATDFFSYLLQVFSDMPPAIGKVIEKSLSVPFSTADPERCVFALFVYLVYPQTNVNIF